MFALPGGDLRIEFDDACRFAEAARIMDELRRIARARVLHPWLDYGRGPDGRLRRVEDAVAARTEKPAERPAASLLAETRTAFPIVVEPKLVLRTQARQGFAAGLVRGTLTGPAGG